MAKPMMLPRWYIVAQGELGQKEISGPRHNPRIVGYFKAIGTAFKDDETPWCAAFVGACLQMAGYASSGTAWARDYLKWGTKIYDPTLGCVVILDRGNGNGHVGFFVKKDDEHIWLLGGNQNNEVNVASFPLSRVLGYRIPAEEPDVILPEEPVEHEAIQHVAQSEHSWKETEENLRDKGSRTITSADNIEGIAKKTVGGLVAAKAVETVTEAAPQTLPSIDWLQQVISVANQGAALASKYWWVPALVAAYFIYQHAKEVRFARVDDARTGTHQGNPNAATTSLD